MANLKAEKERNPDKTIKKPLNHMEAILIFC